MTQAAEWAVELDGVTLQYRTQKHPSLHDISLRIAWGEKIAVLGASGSGKSTLVHLMNGLVPHRFKATTMGTVLVGGVDPRTAPLTDTSRKVGTVLQDSDAQFVALTVAEDIAFSLENQEVPASQMPSIVDEVAERVQLAPLLEQSPHTLSGGQKQRVAVAGVLVDDVPILLFDEPLANLDPATGAATVELIDRLHTDAGKTVIIVEHRLEEVLRRDVDRIVVMDAGRIAMIGTPDEVVASSVLDDLGIRPPLHVTALRRAGVAVTADMRPARLETMQLSDETAERVRQWGESVARRETDAGPAAAAAVELQGVTCVVGATRDSSGVTAVRDVDLTIRRGELVAVVGTNGAGKSTLARLIAGFERASSGAVLVDGEPTAELSVAEIGRRVAYVLQDPNHMISKSMIVDEVALGPRAQGLPDDEVQARVESALRVCGLWSLRSWPITALSHGQRKRVTIAAGLVMQPDLLVLDEPTAGQDLRHFTEFMEFVKGIHEAGTTVIVVTHDMHLALEYTPRVIVMHDGQIIADDAPERVLADTEVTATANLMRTSLYDLGERIGLADDGDFAIGDFIAAFVAEDRRLRSRAGGADG